MQLLPSAQRLRPGLASATRPRPVPSPLSLAPLARRALPACRRPLPAPGASKAEGEAWAPNPADLVKREMGLQSNRLQPELREKVEQAVQALGYRVTVGDVAAAAGVPLARADEVLKALAYDTQASLKVSNEGDVVYGFSPDFRSRLSSRSLVVRAMPAVRAVANAGAYLVRVAFGTTLIASVIIVFLAITALLRGRDDRDDGPRGGGYYGGGGFHGGMFFNVTDLLWYWSPRYYETSAERASRGEMNFLESVFSFVFGDGDPNTGYEERRWKALAEAIRERGGVVTAEEMAPYLDPPEPVPVPAASLYGSSAVAEPYVPYPDEGFVVPALIKLGGEPEVDEKGRILYRFPALQKTGVKKEKRWSLFGRRRAQQQEEEEEAGGVPLESPWQLTAASSGQLFGTLLLGVLNLVGVAVLGGLLADPRAPYVLAAQGLGWVTAAAGPLQLYALGFFAIPGLRWLLNGRKNEAIEARNDARIAAAELLESPPRAAASALESKLAAARLLGERTSATSDMRIDTGAGAAADADRRRAVQGGRLGPRLVGDEDVVFDSGREAGRQLEAVEADDWEQRLAGKGEGRGGARRGDGWGGRGGRGSGGDGWR
ncbi:hypothetical protein HYH03_010740 [Edaphochlamys debaryana]|uniref:Iron-sulfur cluster biosynthesis family protein n=1 Tax=Edaphochlamys debaryana TaxID=47281 RepID=A0A835XV84_9CHLO|nr:hypothetical protein HYH03_010740 [Edaphochlamys debaryana]|eukprot:KAG2490818.1 hypothetical protein HYH03_010740 [Edaphochlamys debaryana]